MAENLRQPRKRAKHNAGRNLARILLDPRAGLAGPARNNVLGMVEQISTRNLRGSHADLDRDLAERFDRLITYRELSALTGTPLGTLYSEVHKGRLSYVRLGPRTVRFRLSDIEAWIASGYRPQRSSGTAPDPGTTPPEAQRGRRCSSRNGLASVGGA